MSAEPSKNNGNMPKETEKTIPDDQLEKVTGGLNPQPLPPSPPPELRRF